MRNEVGRQSHHPTSRARVVPRPASLLLATQSETRGQGDKHFACLFRVTHIEISMRTHPLCTSNTCIWHIEHKYEGFVFYIIKGNLKNGIVPDTLFCNMFFHLMHHDFPWLKLRKLKTREGERVVCNWEPFSDWAEFKSFCLCPLHYLALILLS